MDMVSQYCSLDFFEVGREIFGNERLIVLNHFLQWKEQNNFLVELYLVDNPWQKVSHYLKFIGLGLLEAPGTMNELSSEFWDILDVSGFEDV
jgi:hypothetical protein